MTRAEIGNYLGMTLETASRGYVLQTGSIIASGSCTTLRSDDRVRQAYLGRTVAERVKL